MFKAYAVLTTVRSGRGKPKPVEWEAWAQGIKEAAGNPYDKGLQQVLIQAVEQAKQVLIQWAQSGRLAPPTKPLAGSTIARRLAEGHDTTWLYETGQLINSLEPRVVKLEGADFAVGLMLPGGKPASHGGGKGINYAQLAQMLIYGAVIHVTRPESVRRMMGYLRRLGIIGMGDTPQLNAEEWEGGITIVIPPRGDLFPPAVKNAVSQVIRRQLMTYLRARMAAGMRVIGREHWDASLPAKVRVATRTVRLPEVRA